MAEKGSASRIGIGPIELPEMLQRPQMVSRRGDAEMDIADFHRWAGELEDMMTRELALQVQEMTGAQSVLPHLDSFHRSFVLYAMAPK